MNAEVEGNPLLASIHGVSLKDYAALVMNLGNFDEAALFAAFGIDATQWQEASEAWPQRMTEDADFVIAGLYGQYFAETHRVIERLQAATGAVAAGDAQNIARLRADKGFYLELAGARNAAYAYGLDGAQWVEDNFGIPLLDFQSAAMLHSQDQDHEEVTASLQHQQTMEAKYRDIFAAAQGGNVADDVQF